MKYSLAIAIAITIAIAIAIAIAMAMAIAIAMAMAITIWDVHGLVNGGSRLSVIIFKSVLYDGGYG